jgi:hypothetical protein
MHHPQFQPPVPRKRRYDPLIADKVNEIGLTLVTNSSGIVTGWSFFFLLEDSDKLNPTNLPKSILDSEYFGDVNKHSRTLNSLSQLSTVNKAESAEYNFTLEST